MRKLYLFAIAIFAILGALSVVATAGAPNKPTPECPAGYTKDASSTHNMVLCTRETVREVIRNVPGPERVVVVEKIVEKPVEVIREVKVPGPTRIVIKRVAGKTKVVTKIKRVKVVETHIVFKKFCPKKPNGDLAG